MNERIQELARQAEKWISTTNFESMPEDEMTYDEIFQKKFAELIVRECVNQATWHQDTGSQDVGSEILDYFGIKE